MSALVAVAQGQTPTTQTGGQPSGAAAKVTKTETVVPPRRVVIRGKFKPWARPSARKVRTIIRAEARRWRISPSGLARRVHCESRFQWSAGNGLYQGLLQFAPSTFYRGLGSIRSRRVKLVRTGLRRVHEVTVTRYSDGRVVRKRGRAHRQKVVRVLTGTLPKRPAVTHAWAQLRIGAQAIRGVSAVRSSEWACSA